MISLLVVNYRSAQLAADAVRTARAAASQPLQVVIVDNSCDAREAEALRGMADVLVVSAKNRGYAGGINDGRRACEGETIVVANPDVTFAPHAIDRLHDSVQDAAVAGPALFWDDAHEWMLPPGDLLTGWEKVDEVLASRSRAWFEQRDRRRFRKRVAFWSLERTTSVPMLSGAVMALRASAFDRASGFDERFALYFEETDFLRRMHELRERVVYVPEARCRHLYNQSAGQVADQAAARYAESELRYLEKWLGPFAARFLKRIERPMPPGNFEELRGTEELILDRDDVVVEASPLPSFTTAAGHFPTSRSVHAPTGLWRGPLYVRIVQRGTGAVIGTYKIAA
jgi:N-acetylglucosaminyl-diphospho-decaprenol L-rhamnosyltransferase